MLKILTEKKISKPKAIIFDTDNTLYPYEAAHSAAINAVSEKAENILGINKKEFENLFIQFKKTKYKCLHRMYINWKMTDCPPIGKFNMKTPKGSYTYRIFNISYCIINYISQK